MIRFDISDLGGMSVGMIGEKSGREKVSKKHWKQKEEKYEEEKQVNGVPAGGFLIGRHPECDRVINQPTVSNRHCLLFSENKNGDSLAVLEDLSGNGTYVNEALVGRNKRRELQDGDDRDDGETFDEGSDDEAAEGDGVRGEGKEEGEEEETHDAIEVRCAMFLSFKQESTHMKILNA